MDDGEMYIKDFIGEAKYTDPQTRQLKKSSGILHFCTRSLFFESDNSTSTIGILRYPYKMFLCPPSPTSSQSMKVLTSKVIEIPLGKVPKPYLIHKAEAKED